MQLMAMTYVTDMAKSVAFYESLGLIRAQPGEIDQFWNMFAIGDARLALHHSTPEEIPPADKHLQLSFNVTAAGELDRLRVLCREQAHAIGGDIEGLGFGRFFWITDPDGLYIQFSEVAEAS